MRCLVTPTSYQQHVSHFPIFVSTSFGPRDAHISPKCLFAPLFFAICVVSLESLLSSVTLGAAVCKMYLHLISFVLFIEPFLSPLDDYIFLSRCRGRFVIIWVKIQNDSVSFSGEQWGSACCISAQVSLFFPSFSTVSLCFLRMCFDVLCWLRSC